MGLKESAAEVLKLYEEINNRTDCTDDGAATLTLTAVLHSKNFLVHNTVSVGGESASGGLHHGNKF